MKLYLIISIIINTILMALIYKNHSIVNSEYQLNWQIIPSILLYIFLSIKLILDMIYIYTKKNIIKKISYVFISILVILWFVFVPNGKVAISSYQTTLKTTIELNHKLFKKLQVINKIPNDSFIKSLKKELPISPYLKYGKSIKYNLVVSNGNKPVDKADKPGDIFLVIDKDKNDFIFTASVLDINTNEVKMLHLGDDLFFVDKKLNMLQISDSKEFIDSLIQQAKRIKN